MRKISVILCIIMILMIHSSLFAGGKRETPTKHNVYVHGGYPSVKIGYEGAIGNIFSLGAYFGASTVPYGPELVLTPRFYFGSALERFFIGGNLGLGNYSFYNENEEDYSTVIYPNFGLEIGYKFVFGSGSGGFSLEPSIGLNILNYLNDDVSVPITIGLSLGYAWGGKGVQDGIYVGIVTFGPDAEDITGGTPILLDSAGLSRLKTQLNRYERENSIGTALFYAAHMGLANMKKAESRIPRNLRKVTMVTFTDGLDVSSTGLGLADITDPGGQNSRAFRAGEITPYRDFISREIRNRKINGTQVEAYIAAVRGDDVTDTVSFEAARRSLASEGDKYGGNRNLNFAELEERFEEIAKEIVPIDTQTSFTLITPQYAVGTKIRMTFNSETTSQEAQNAQQYIEGEVTVSGNDYYLSNIRYGGGLLSEIPQGGRIKGEIKRGEVNYAFPRLYGFDFNKSQADLNRLLRQWLMSSGSSAWQINSEYTARDATSKTIQRQNAVIYLILDKSSSINPNDVRRVREAANKFIDTLYNEYHQR